MRPRLATIGALFLLLGATAHGQTCTTQAYFTSPEAASAAQTAVLQTIQGARRTLDLALPGLADSALGDAVVQAFRRGVAVRVVLPKGAEAEVGGQYGKLAAGRVPVAFAPTQFPFLHRFAVVDGTTVITGSYGWTGRTGGYDSVVLIRCPSGSSGRAVVDDFAREFERLWERFGREAVSASPPPPAGGLASVAIYEIDRVRQCIALLNTSSATIDISGIGP